MTPGLTGCGLARIPRAARSAMRLISRLEQESRLDRLVSAGQRAARLIRPGMLRDVLHGAARLLVATGLIAAVPAALAGAPWAKKPPKPATASCSSTAKAMSRDSSAPRRLM
jgi:hypothetical protein